MVLEILVCHEEHGASGAGIFEFGVESDIQLIVNTNSILLMDLSFLLSDNVHDHIRSLVKILSPGLASVLHFWGRVGLILRIFD